MGDGHPPQALARRVERGQFRPLGIGEAQRLEDLDSFLGQPKSALLQAVGARVNRRYGFEIAEED